MLWINAVCADYVRRLYVSGRKAVVKPPRDKKQTPIIEVLRFLIKDLFNMASADDKATRWMIKCAVMTIVLLFGLQTHRWYSRDVAPVIFTSVRLMFSIFNSPGSIRCPGPASLAPHN